MGSLLGIDGNDSNTRSRPKGRRLPKLAQEEGTVCRRAALRERILVVGTRAGMPCHGLTFLGWRGHLGAEEFDGRFEALAGFEKVGPEVACFFETGEDRFDVE